MASHLKSERESIQRSFEMVRSINEKRRLLDLLFVAEFAQEQQSKLRYSGLKQPEVEELVSLWIDSGVQPMALVVDSNHRLVQRNLIRASLLDGCRSAFCIQL